MAKAWKVSRDRVEVVEFAGTDEEAMRRGLIKAKYCWCGYVFPLYLVSGGITFAAGEEGALVAHCPGCGTLTHCIRLSKNELKVNPS